MGVPAVLFWVPRLTTTLTYVEIHVKSDHGWWLRPLLCSTRVLPLRPPYFLRHQFSTLDNARVTKILYQNIMSMEPDTSPRNVRVAPSKPVDNSEGKVRRFGVLYFVSLFFSCIPTYLAAKNARVAKRSKTVGERKAVVVICCCCLLLLLLLLFIFLLSAQLFNKKRSG